MLHLRVRPPPPDGRSTRPAQSPADKREEQGEEAGDREDRPQPLLRDALRCPAGRSGQRHPGELVYKAGTQRATHDRENERNQQGEQGHYEALLEAGAPRHAPRGVASDKEGYEERQEQADEPGYTAARSAVSDAQRREYAAHHGGDDAAQDQAGTQRGEPAENEAYPAGARLGLTPLAIGGALLARVSYPARTLLPSRPSSGPPPAKSGLSCTSPLRALPSLRRRAGPA